MTFDIFFASPHPQAILPGIRRDSAQPAAIADDGSAHENNGKEQNDSNSRPPETSLSSSRLHV
jgi:hypothetical protein